MKYKTLVLLTLLAPLLPTPGDVAVAKPHRNSRARHAQVTPGQPQTEGRELGRTPVAKYRRLRLAIGSASYLPSLVRRFRTGSDDRITCVEAVRQDGYHAGKGKDLWVPTAWRITYSNTSAKPGAVDVAIEGTELVVREKSAYPYDVNLPVIKNWNVSYMDARQSLTLQGGFTPSGDSNSFTRLAAMHVDGALAPVWVLHFTYPDDVQRFVRADTGAIVFEKRGGKMGEFTHNGPTLRSTIPRPKGPGIWVGEAHSPLRPEVKDTLQPLAAMRAYFPLAVGDTWVYKRTVVRQPLARYIYTILEDDTGTDMKGHDFLYHGVATAMMASGTESYTVKTADGDGFLLEESGHPEPGCGLEPCALQDVEKLTWSIGHTAGPWRGPATIWEHREGDLFGRTAAMDMPIGILTPGTLRETTDPEEKDDGEYEALRGELGDRPVGITDRDPKAIGRRIVAANLEGFVTVQAGRFKDCIVNTVSFKGLEDEDVTITRVFAPNVGLVKEIETGSEGETLYELELLKFTVK